HTTSELRGASVNQADDMFHVRRQAWRADGLEGFVTITGGKATTLRGMAELCADVVCRKLDIDEPCRTRETVLLPHAAYYAAAA
ncbi:MAG: hypothetical protein ACXVE4_04440, partial [Solirubrobacteraceae bacterium]